MTAGQDPVDRPQGVNLRSVDGLDEGMIRRVVDRFYARVRDDEVIGPIFRHAIPEDGWQGHLGTITDFWSSVLLGSGRYNGRPMPKHLAIPGIGDQHFRRWLALFRVTVEELCPPPVAALMVERSETIANSFRLSISMHRGEDLIRMKPLGREDYPQGQR